MQKAKGEALAVKLISGVFAEVAAWRRSAAPNGGRIFTLTRGFARCPSDADFGASQYLGATYTSGYFSSLAA